VRCFKDLRPHISQLKFPRNASRQFIFDIVHPGKIFMLLLSKTIAANDARMNFKRPIKKMPPISGLTAKQEAGFSSPLMVSLPLRRATPARRYFRRLMPIYRIESSRPADLVPSLF
jgi:hypothetical protein